MNEEPLIERVSKLNLNGLSLGEQILYCPVCDWQASRIGMKPVCPTCGEPIRQIRIDQELITIVNWRKRGGVMNLEKIREKVQLIRDNSNDPEVAHLNEDSLRYDFIKHVEEAGSPELKEMATEILKTEDIEFERWCS